MDRIVFLKPVHVGDVVSFYTECERVGTTSVTMLVTVEVDHRNGCDTVTTAEVTYVNVDENRRPIPVPARS